MVRMAMTLVFPCLYPSPLPHTHTHTHTHPPMLHYCRELGCESAEVLAELRYDLPATYK